MKTLLHLKMMMISLIIGTSTFSQFVDYERDTKWNFGLNIGGTWQDADINLQRPGLGYGFTFGRAIYEQPNSMFGLDLRFRYLRGKTFGLDPDRYLVDSATDGGYYADNAPSIVDSGYTYLNNETDLHDFSLEAVLKFHRLRERTGILFHVFGGVGITDFGTKTNLTDANGFNYDYSSLPVTGADPTFDHENILDEDYESNAAYHEERQVKFMPSLGIGIGYQITPSFSIGLEHRTTFTLYDQFDGVEQPGSEFLNLESGNDIYHYSALNLRWNLFRGKASQEEDTYDPQDPFPCDKPYVSFVTPRANEKFETQYISISAKVARVLSNNDIVVKVNNIVVATQYSLSTELVTANATLLKGNNTIEIIASNKCGRTVVKRNVSFQEKECLKPYVKVNSPLATAVNQRTQKLNATVIHLNQGTVNVTLNGQTTPHTLNGQSLNATLNLVEGNNSVAIKAQNECGDTTLFINLQYKDEPCLSPVISIQTPQNNSRLTRKSVTLSARIDNMLSNDSYTVKLNGVTQQASFSPSSNMLTAGLQLTGGNNSIVVTATNKCGTDTKVINVIVEKEPCLAPVISILNPSNGIKVSSPTVNLSATINNVVSANQVSVSVNGRINASSFNSARGNLSSLLKLQEGTNTITINAQNECGNDVKTITVIYEKLPCLAPVISIIAPQNGQVFNNNSTAISASISNIVSGSQVTCLVNGNRVASSYNASTRMLTANTVLNKGNNTVSITATNDCGSVTETVVVTYQCPTPVITVYGPTTGSVVNVANVSLNAAVSGVSNKNEIVVSLNGSNVPFNFNTQTGSITGSFSLRNGVNTIRISVNTACGVANKSIDVTYNKPCDKPVVTITSPINSQVTSNSQITIAGSATNVTNRSQISVTLNGNPVNVNVSGNGTLSISGSATLTQSGNNTIVITATNSCGADAKSVLVNYKANVPCPKPVLSIITPVDGKTYTTKNVTFSTVVANITSSSQVVVKLNGRTISSSFNSRTNQVTASLSLIEGNNAIEVVATNSCGNAQQSINVTFRCDKPKINFINQNGINRAAATATTTIVARVTNVTATSQITVKLNGNVIPHNFATSTGVLTITTTLKKGKNTIDVMANNACGSDNQNLVIDFNPPCAKPTVSIAAPRNGAQLTSPTVKLVGSALNITSNNQLTVKLNGKVQSTTFTSSNNSYQSTLSLISGNNTIEVTATNSCGTATKTITVNYKKPCVAPAVTITSPAKGSAISSSTVNYTARVTGSVIKSNITVRLNGTLLTNFSYNASTGIVSGTANVTQTGTNRIAVFAMNDCGQIESANEFTKKAPCVKPIITVGSPTNGSTVNTGTIKIDGYARNVSQAQITIKVNGQSKTFNYSSKSNIYSLNTSLISGTNTIVITATNACGSVTKTIMVNYNKPCVKPTVSISTPAGGAKVTRAAQRLTGSVTEITSGSQLTVKLNGVTQQASYNASSKSFEADLILNNGSNTIMVSAQNNCGNAIKTITVTYNQPCVKPGVTISTPAKGANVSTSRVNYSARITGTVIKNNISVSLNGNSLSTFNYNASTGIVSGTATVTQTGNNRLAIFVINDCGQIEVANEFTKAAPCVKPNVSLISPANGSQVNVANVKIDGYARNVSQAQITITVNGKAKTFNYSSKSNIYSLNTSLIEGKNTIVVKATNACGTVTKTSVVTYKKPCSNPSVAIAAPKNGFKPKKNVVNFSAAIENIKTSRDVVVKLNGKTVKFTLIGNKVSGLVTLTKKGNNKLEIIATNTCGKVTKSVNILYSPITPIIKVSFPTTNPTNVGSTGSKISGNVSGITSPSQFVIKIGKDIQKGVSLTRQKNGSYNFNAEVRLQKGENTVVLEAINNYKVKATKSLDFVVGNVKGGTKTNNTTPNVKAGSIKGVKPGGGKVSNPRR